MVSLSLKNNENGYEKVGDRIMEKVREKCPELMKRKGGQAPS